METAEKELEIGRLRAEMEAQKQRSETFEKSLNFSNILSNSMVSGVPKNAAPSSPTLGKKNIQKAEEIEPSEAKKLLHTLDLDYSDEEMNDDKAKEEPVPATESSATLPQENDSKAISENPTKSKELEVYSVPSSKESSGGSGAQKLLKRFQDSIDKADIDLRIAQEKERKEEVDTKESIYIAQQVPLIAPLHHLFLRPFICLALGQLAFDPQKRLHPLDRPFVKEPAANYGITPRGLSW